MRWSGQQVFDDGVGSGLALPGLRGLLRTVRVPEFAGTTFHEVEAKSALNRVPGTSPVPFRWTVNPYRGCGHACVYCLAGPTPVLLADGSHPADRGAAGRRRRARHRAGRREGAGTCAPPCWRTGPPRSRLTGSRLADGTVVLASGEHRFLTTHGWRHVGAGWCRSGPGPRRRRGCIRATCYRVRARSRAAGTPRVYRQGYLHGLVRAERRAPVVRDGRIDASFPSDRLELEALGRAHHFLAPRRSRVGSRTRGSSPRRRGRPCGGRHPPVRRGAVSRRSATRGDGVRPPTRTTTGARACSAGWRTPRAPPAGASAARHGGRRARSTGDRGAAPVRVRLRRRVAVATPAGCRAPASAAPAAHRRQPGAPAVPRGRGSGGERGP